MTDSVFIVEDEQLVALDIQMQIQRSDLELYGKASSAEDALSILEKGQNTGNLPSLVLMDINLAGTMNGIEAARSIRESYDIPVVILTAYTDEETVNLVKGSDAFGYLVKPITGRQLEITISFALYRHRMLRTLREKDRQLAHAQRMEAIGRMSAGLAHEFNNLVTVMMGHMRLIVDDVAMLHESERNIPEIDDLKKNTSGLKDTIERAGKLSRQLLSFTRDKKPRLEQVKVEHVVSAVDRMVRGVLPESIHFNVDGLPLDITIRADPSRLEHALINLILNARDAVNSSGCISLVVRGLSLTDEMRTHDGYLEPGQYVEFTVHDDGVGIEPEIMNHIFEPFFTTKQIGYGSGFGLATVYATITEIGGGVTVRSTPGKGTEFHLYLPRS